MQFFESLNLLVYYQSVRRTKNEVLLWNFAHVFPCLIVIITFSIACNFAIVLSVWLFFGLLLSGCNNLLAYILVCDHLFFFFFSSSLLSDCQPFVRFIIFFSFCRPFVCLIFFFFFLLSGCNNPSCRPFECVIFFPLLSDCSKPSCQPSVCFDQLCFRWLYIYKEIM